MARHSLFTVNRQEEAENAEERERQKKKRGNRKIIITTKYIYREEREKEKQRKRKGEGGGGGRHNRATNHKTAPYQTPRPARPKVPYLKSEWLTLFVR